MCEKLWGMQDEACRLPLGGRKTAQRVDGACHCGKDIRRRGRGGRSAGEYKVMDAVSTVEGRAYPFGMKNVDTDMIIAAKWLKTISRSGLGKGAFEALRQRSEEHTSELQSLMRISYAVFCLKKKKKHGTLNKQKSTEV